MTRDTMSVFRVPGFWAGCFEARRQMLANSRTDYERAAHAAAQIRIEAIADGLAQGLDLEDIPEFKQWLGYERGSYARA